MWWFIWITMAIIMMFNIPNDDDGESIIALADRIVRAMEYVDHSLSDFDNEWRKAEVRWGL